jgi:hypothetical protein
VGAAHLVEAPVVGDLGKERREPERAHRRRKLLHPEPRVVGDDVRADERAVDVEDGRNLPRLLLDLPPPLAVRPRRERRQVRPVQPLPPPDLRDVERERLPVFGFERLVEGLRPVGREDGVHVGVGAVDAAVVEAHAGALLGPGHPLAGVGDHVALGEAGGDLAADLERRQLRPERQLDLLAPGEAPLRHLDRAPAGVAQGVLDKVVADVVVEVPVAQGVALARGDVEDLRGLGATDAGGEDGVHDVVHGDDVHEGLGVAGELAQEALGVGHDDGVGHAGALDPTG